MKDVTTDRRIADSVRTAQLDKLCTSIRGKLQFMDYLVRAAVADVDRFQGETDAGTRIFIRQLIEMHASNLAVESENMRLDRRAVQLARSDRQPAPTVRLRDLRNGDAA